MDHEEACTQLGGLASSYARVVRGADLTTPVPTCPGWDLRKLTRHLGTTYRWANEIVRRRSGDRVDTRTLDLHLPPNDEGLADWIERSAGELLATLRHASPDAPVWTWGADRHVRFWSRRLVHETVVHTADAVLALGDDPLLDPELAVDAIEELLEHLPMAVSFAPRVAELRGRGETIAIRCDDAAASWVVSLAEDGFTWARSRAVGDVRISGPAGQLELLLYGRRPRTHVGLTCTGDGALLDHWLEHSSL